MPDAAPMVDITDLQRLVGPASFQRGLTYARAGFVTLVRWDSESRIVSGCVSGTGPLPYRCSALISATTGKPTGGLCSCPVGFDCKHVAALLLRSNTTTLTQLSGLTLPKTVVVQKQADWKSAVIALTERPEASRSRSARIGLLLELRELIPRSRSQWNGPIAKPATATSRGTLRLGVRPVLLSATGNWIRGNISWNSLGYQANRLDLATDQQRWFAQFAALHRSTREVYSGQEPDWLYLDDFHSPLLWQLLADAQAQGIALVTGKKETRVTIGSVAAISIDAQLEGELRLSPNLQVDGEPHPAATAAAIGDHGIYAWEFDPRPRFTLAATSAPLADEQRALLGAAQPVVIPASDVDEFLRDFYPRLSRVITVTSADASVVLPEHTPPVLVLTVGYQPKQAVKIAWDWDYSGQRKSLRGADDRDFSTEHRVLAAVTRLLDPVTDDTLRGLDAAEFVTKVLPTLERVDGLRVESVGTRPDYRELTGIPKLTFTTVATDTSDWFDLGVYIRIDGRDVPFTKVFTALSKGMTKVLLVDNSYLSLNQPVFEELKRLIDEASTLAEWETGVRISRYQASLWSEFEDLADETLEAQAWREAAKGLLAIESIEPTELPVTVDATLRPYQKEGFDWLAFLWSQKLGGILADDMGLGKTLQALALIAHAQAGGASAPFLIVAPTSVVSNWLAEATRFTPSLTVRCVTTTKQSLATLADGADIVVTSYALFRLGFEKYQSIGWSGLVLDEAQFVKNPASKAHGAAVALTAPFKLAITGTPMENSLTDLWALFAITAPGLFASGRRFAEEYARPISAGGAAADSAQNAAALIGKLRRRIRPLMMRRTKDLVASELPAKQEQILRVELAPRHRKLYDIVLQKERQKLLGLIDDLDRNRFIVFRSLTLLRMLSLDASLVDEAHADIPSSKLDALFEQLDDVVAEGHRALIFSQFTSFLRKAAGRLDAAGIAYEYLDGSTLHRADVIARFKSGDAPVFLISLKAGGFGLNLTEADYVFLLDPWWNPATETQAVDRTHRIGQTRPVNVYRLVATGTIEEKVMALRDRKAKLFDAVMDDDAIFSTALTADDIRGLLE
ncbi:DEAD/DEAH box helicase [Frigoribacterium sp. CG_9.8]|uniref:DEAD/DEAH box helicase n=1 Tax=Frigoribacterium sp. CG_9.8 TaxID=2787733 RepID=UPI001A241839|nr:DEAD/DEAH box helicase [Frigoribacterium sp. CG_9.8]MBG6108207.1 superfamily II DNA or RNA helicase [Frigoribacterium sp. CG_9.8]